MKNLKNDDETEEFLVSTDQSIDKHENQKRKTTKVKKFIKNTIKKPIVYLPFVVLTIVFIAWATLQTKSAFDNYEQGLINKGIQLEKDRQSALDKEVAARSKQVQQ